MQHSSGPRGPAQQRRPLPHRHGGGEQSVLMLLIKAPLLLISDCQSVAL